MFKSLVVACALSCFVVPSAHAAARDEAFRSAISSALAHVKNDLKVLQKQGREAFVDRLFEGITSDQKKTEAAVDHQEPEPGKLKATIAKFLKAIRERIVAMPAEQLKAGLERIITFLEKVLGGSSLEALAEGEGWFERVFSNTTLVRNLLVTLVVVPSIGVAVVLAVNGAGVAAVATVVTSLIGIIELLNHSAAQLWAMLN